MTIPIMSYSEDYRFHHYHTVKYCCEQLKAIEALAECRDIHAVIRHQAYASSAVLAAVAFLEAAINSFALHTLEEEPPQNGDLPSNPRERLGAFSDFMQDFSLLNRYQFALSLAGHAPFDTGADPYQSTYLLIRLRNALVHFVPEMAHQLDAHAKLERQLRKRFPLNPLVDDTYGLFFPRRCLGLGCAEWSLSSATNFLTSFYRRMGTPSSMAELEIGQGANKALPPVP